MDAFILIKLIVILLLVIGNAFFVGSEIALTSARRSRVHHLAQKGDSSAKMVHFLQSEPERFYSVTQIGITLMSLGLGAIGISTIVVVLKPLIDFAVLLLSNIVPPLSAYHAVKISVHVFAFLFISALHIVGILSVKELLNRFRLDGGAREVELPISKIMLPPYVAPEAKSLRSLLADFRVQRQQMAIVIDEFGVTAGLVTLEGILEEIVGEYEDELSDVPKYCKDRDKDGIMLIDPAIRLEDLEESIQFSFPDGKYNTLAGLITSI
jgi:CBS domain containing-hemolysin-like protein